LSGLGAEVGFVNGSAPAPKASNQRRRALVSGALVALEKVITRIRANSQISTQGISKLTRRKQFSRCFSDFSNVFFFLDLADTLVACG
jgi:hypothetical protein